jgi:ABC-type nitrate/sulfonate/bicarbonate transport system ATPase subunit
MKQRVAIARALALDAPILPWTSSALTADAAPHGQWLLGIWARTRKTVVF